MADFDLTQTDAQVQAILNDGQSAMGAGAQTTLTTEYVMLKDINGIYHKILKSSFTEAIRDVLAGLLVNNDKGTTINQIAAIASGDFGSVTPANLASVLGGQSNWLSEGQNIDNILTPGDYAAGSNSIAQSLTGTLPPLNPIAAFRLEVRNTMGGRPVQRYYDFNGNSFSRAFNGSVWTSWSRVDNFGCGTLAELKAALNALP